MQVSQYDPPNPVSTGDLHIRVNSIVPNHLDGGLLLLFHGGWRRHRPGALPLPLQNLLVQLLRFLLRQDPVLNTPESTTDGAGLWPFQEGVTS
jgi:hypothetical protein